jgi:hypothetical protein
VHGHGKDKYLLQQTTEGATGKNCETERHIYCRADTASPGRLFGETTWGQQVSARFYASYLLVAIVTVSVIGALADTKHREIFAQGLDSETSDEDALYFTAIGFADRTLAIFPADNSPVHCDEIADWLALGGGAAGLSSEGFTSVQCGDRREKIITNEHPPDGGTGEKENEPTG